MAIGPEAGRAALRIGLDGLAERIVPFMQNLRRGHYELGIDAPGGLRVAAAFTELATAI